MPLLMLSWQKCKNSPDKHKRNIEGNEMHKRDFTTQRKIRNQGKNLNYP